MPELGFVYDESTRRRCVSLERSEPGWTGWAGWIGLGAWVGLLLAGTIAVYRSSVDREFRAGLALLIGGQFALHLCYGDEIFLYSLHFAPFLCSSCRYCLYESSAQTIAGFGNDPHSLCGN